MKSLILSNLCGFTVFALQVACVPAQSTGDFPPQTRDATATSDVALADISGGNAENLTGTWAMATDWSTCVPIGDGTELRTFKLLQVKLVQQGARLKETRTVCSVTNTPLLGMVTVFPPALIASFVPQQIDSTLLGTGKDARYFSGIDIQNIGVKLTDPLAETLPDGSDMKDARIFDSDKDGNRGATLEIGTCKAYVVQRAVAVMVSQVTNGSRIDVTSAQTNVQHILDSSGPLCGISPETTPRNGGNAVAFVRVDAAGLNLDTDKDGEVSCAEIIKAQAQFAQPLAADDAHCHLP